MAFFWVITTPLQWLCAPFWVLISIVPTVLQLAVALITLSLVYVAAKNIISKAQQSNARANRAAIAPSVLKVLPLHSSTGWTLDGVAQLRVFQRQFSALDSQPYLASHVLVDMNPKNALEVAVECADLPNWMYIGSTAAVSSAQPVTAAGQGLQHSDVIAITFSGSREDKVVAMLTNIWKKSVRQALIYIPQLEKLVPTPLDFRIVQFERTWESIEGGATYLFCEPRQPASFSYRWSMLVFTSVQSQEEMSLATMVVMPSGSLATVREEVSSQLCSLQEHILLRRHKVLLSRLPLPTVTLQQRRAPRQPQAKVRGKPPSAPSQETDKGKQRTSATKPEQRPTSPSSPLRSHSTADSAHLALVGRVCKDMLAMAEATEGDGWVSEGVVNNVVVMKKPPAVGEPPLTCIKGTGTLQVPPEFVMVVLTDDQYAQQLDDMLKDLRIVQEVIPKTVGILHLQYKAVWPTSGRDFVLVNFQGRVNDKTLIQGGTSIVDPRVPEDKAYVRGDCIVGGYVIKKVEGNPNACEVTYVGKLDLKGNIPAFVVNKAMASQPQCVNRLRGIVEPLYARAKGDAHLMRTLMDTVKINDLFANEQTASQSQAGHEEDMGVATEGVVAGGGGSSVRGGDLYSDGDDRNPDGSASMVEGEEEEMERAFTPPNLSTSEDDGEEGPGGSVAHKQLYKQLPLYVATQYEGSVPEAFIEESITYPKSATGVDYRTLGNQIAARVMEETFNVSGLDPSDASTYSDQPGGWQYVGTEKGVCIMQKRPDNSSHYCFVGKAVISLHPDYVYSSIKNPQLRHAYDNMLKELHIVKAIDTGLYILHMHHETTQCFLKQSRDFCLLVAERSELDKRLLVASSIEVPECPPNPSIVRGKVFYSGWVVEPRTQRGGAVVTDITYLLQVDFGGPIPTYLLNIISQRQPLAVAYLRDYLMSNLPPE